jgi:hypothetical protein
MEPVWERPKGHFTHRDWGPVPWPLHFNHSHWWECSIHTTLEGPTKYANEMQDGWMDVKVYMDGFLHGIKWIMFHGHLDYFQKPPVGGRPHTKPLGDYGTRNIHNRWFGVWGLAWIEIHWNSIWLRAPSHMISHYTWGFVTTLNGMEVSWDGLHTLSFGLS